MSSSAPRVRRLAALPLALLALVASLLLVPATADAAPGDSQGTAVQAARPHHHKVRKRKVRKRKVKRCGKHKAAVKLKPPKAGKHKHKRHKAKWRCVKVPRKLVTHRSVQQQLIRAGTRLP